MSIPINGRIAILDDEIEQVKPIIEELSKRQCPVTYYSGKLSHLPEEGSQNDVRILFLDIHLTGNEARTEKEIRGILINYISRIISINNFPYLLIYWSRHEDDYKDLIENEVFDSDQLKERKPIAFLSLRKSEYFHDNGEKTDKFEELIEGLFARLNDLIESIPVYNHLIEWENIAHISTDKTLEEVFSTVKNADEWEKNANKLFKALGLSYSGRQYFDIPKLDQNRSSLFTLNSLLNDTIEYEIESNEIIKEEISYEDDQGVSISLINSKLLIHLHNNRIDYPGSILLSEDDDDDYRVNLLNQVLNHSLIKEEVLDKQPDLKGKALKRAAKALIKDILEKGEKIWMIFEPLCDYVQKKTFYNKVLRGVLLPYEYFKFLSQGSDAVYVTPKFEFKQQDYVVILYFRNLKTIDMDIENDKEKCLFRFKQNLFSDVQSKFSAFLNRQGVLFLDDKLF